MMAFLRRRSWAALLLWATCFSVCDAFDTGVVLGRARTRSSIAVRNLSEKKGEESRDESASNAIEVSEEEPTRTSPSPSSPPPTAPAAQIPSGMSADQIMRALNTSPRRIAISILSSTALALGANFLGVTSKLLETLPESTVEATSLDTFYPRGDYKRYKSNGYTFVIPKEWVADTALELQKSQRRAMSLDYSIPKSKSGGVLPDAAFGPPGRLNARGVSQGDTNVSVVISNVGKGFSLEQNLGSPTEAAETLLRVSLAPPGSGRTAQLVNAEEDALRGVYQLEYTVDRGERGPPLQAISVIAVRNGDTLLTQTVVAPREEWQQGANEIKLRKIASSFHLV